MVGVLKQIVGLKEIMQLQTVRCDGTDKVTDVLQLKHATIEMSIQMSVLGVQNHNALCLIIVT